MDTGLSYKAPLRAPFTVCLWLTDYCNLSCKYCYAKPFSGKRMETKRLLTLIDELIELQVFDLTLAGGEPLLHPDILEIVERSLSGGIRVGILTNGLKLTPELVSRLETKSNGKNLIIQISLDSTDSAINDYTRGQTSEVVRNLHSISSSSIEFQMACVVHKLNSKSAHTIIEQFYPKIKRFHFLNIQRTEEALKHPELLIDQEEAMEFWLNLNEYSKQFPEDLFLPSLRIQMRAMGGAKVDPEFTLHENATFDCESCSAGHTHINVDANFNMLGCDIAKDHTYMGNLANASFNQVWNSALAHQVRTAPYPACYKIKNENGESQLDFLKNEFKAEVGIKLSF